MNFNQMDSVQHMDILHKAAELLEYLKQEYPELPDNVLQQGLSSLHKAIDFIDDEIIHKGL